MTTPEKSVEEIVEEFQKKFRLNPDIANLVDDWLTKTLQTERQKREEVVHEWNKAEQRLDGTAQGAVNAIEQFRHYLSNNEK